MVMQEKYKKTYKQMWETKCARFNAHARLHKLATRASTAVIVLTFTVVALSAFKAGAFFDLPDKTQRAGDLALVLCSIALLIIELYVKGQRYDDLAKEFHKSGTEIARIYDLFVFEASQATPNDAAIKDIITQYHDKIDSRNINHTYVDDQLVKAQHPKDFGIRWWLTPAYRGYIELKLFIVSGGIYSLIAWLSLLGTIATILFFGAGSTI
ncbi:SLATT domain-containing protein [Dongia sp.]|uniref:SLATT domain-containing protein n=1 Tax=Dongia sp. TaxID=1977262 RepID=UPI0035AF57BF